MRKFVLFLSLFLLSVCFYLCSLAGDKQPVLQYNDYQYRILDDNTIEIADYIGAGGEVVIPAEIDGMPVVSIGKFAFSSCKTIKTVVIPDGVSSIREKCFYSCSLTGITIPDSVTMIGNNAFAYSSLEKIELPSQLSIIASLTFSHCEKLTHIRFPDISVSVGSCAFINCESLASFDVPADHPNLAVTDGVLFSKPDKKLVCYPAGKQGTSYSVPDGTLIIGDSSFRGCESLSAVIIPDTVVTIEDEAFFCCTGLTDITIPSGVQTVGNSVFERCENISSVRIEGNVKLDCNPFPGCPRITTIEIDEHNTAMKLVDGVLFSKDGKNLILFPGGSDLPDYCVPDGTEVIQQYAFCSCNALQRIIIPDSVTDIQNASVMNCERLTSINIPDGVTSLCYPFIACDRLEVTVSPGSYAAQYCIENDYPIMYRQN